MAEKLTNEQQAAVNSRERSLLVSAAAGSGKTKVLVERLFSYVEREGANLDDFLIITYTRAAASELRGKIAKALNERMERDPGNYHLRQQMLRGHQNGGRVLHLAPARKLPSARRGRTRTRAAPGFPRVG